MVMKREKSLIVQCCLLLAFFYWPVAMWAQGNTVSLNCKSQSLTSVLKEVEKQSGYYKINYNYGELASYKVTIHVQSVTAPESVEKLLVGLPLTSVVKGKFIQINKQSLPGNEQRGKRKVTGRLFDSHGEPLIGATVKEVGTHNATVTDSNGNFELDAVSDDAVLEYSYIGMKTYRRKASAKSAHIILEDDDHSLGDVVVTGMNKIDRRMFTGAATSIKAEDAKIDGLADISRSLEGRAAGVSVQNVTGTFGTAPKIRVRGATSIYGSSKPLWVVDGVIMEDVVDVSADDLSSGDANTLISSAIAGLNADDIESFQILKDGSATSIYGARAMAGVIVVTTKKGKSGQAHINYTGEYTMRLIPSYAEFNIMNSQDQMSVYQELYQKGYLNYAETANAKTSGVYGKMYELISKYDETSGQFGLANTDKAKAAYLRQAEFRNTNWFKELFSASIMLNHSVSMSGGTDKSQYYASLSAMYDPGWPLQSKVQRYTANMNTTFHVNDRLNFNLIGNASYRSQKAPGTLNREIDAVSGTVNRSFDINPYSYALNTSRALDKNEYYTRNYAPFNIFHELDNNYMDLKVTDIRVQGRVNYQPIRQIELSLLGAAKYSATSQEHSILDDSNQAQAYRAMPTSVIRDANSLLYKDPDNIYALPITVLPNGGIFNRTDNSMFGWDMRASLSYHDTFADQHIVNFYGGMETNCVDRRSTWFRGWGMQYSLGEIPFYAYEVFKKSAEENTDYYSLSNTHERSVAFFGNATYSWRNRYILNGTLRYEGTNRLGRATSARWLPTWNISTAWNAHEEKWFSNFKPVLSHFTLKASYSLTADRGPASVTNALAIISAYNPWRPFTSVKESGLQIAQLANEDLTYEKKHELNIGVDLGFLNNRINVSADWYTRNNYDLIGVAHTPGLGGEVEKFGNIASMKSNGLELTISSTNIKKKNFSWTTNLIYSHTHNEVTDLRTAERLVDLVQGTGFAMEGYPVRSIFSVPFAGLNRDGLPQFYNSDGNITVSGINFQESDPENLKFLKYSGSADPTDMGSLGNIFKYKGFTMNVYITYSFGNVVRLDPVFSNEYDDMVSTPKEFRNRWSTRGDEAITDIPVIASLRQNRIDTNLSHAYSAYNYSDARIAKGDFIRMKEISLGYDFPENILKVLKVSTLSLKMQATNLFLLYADKKLNGQDPEFFNAGGVAVPMAKQFTFTLRLGI